MPQDAVEVPNNGRIKAVMILCIFVSPLASLVRLGIHLYDKIIQEPLLVLGDADDHSSRASQSLHPLAQLIQDPDMEELIRRIFSSQFKFGSYGNFHTNFLNLRPNPLHILASISAMTGTSNTASGNSINTNTQPSPDPNPILSPPLQMQMMHHDLQQVLPFLFIFFFLLLGPMLIAFTRKFHEAGHDVYDYPGQGQRRNEVQRRMRKKMQKRKRRLLLCLQDFQMEITDGHLQKIDNISRIEDVDRITNQSCTSTNEQTEGPRDQATLQSPCPIERIANNSTCAICLCNYGEGQSIVWSSNRMCIHVFHHDCMKQWIEKRADGDCPCCRRQFVDEHVYEEAKKKELKVD